MTCPYRIPDCGVVDRDTDLWTGTLPKRAPNRHGFVHRHNHLPCVTDGPDSETGWHPADDEPHPEPWPWRRARHPIQLAHPQDGRILGWRVIASTVASTRTEHAPALAALDGIYDLAQHPGDLAGLPLEQLLASVSWRTVKARTLLALAARWDTRPTEWRPSAELVADLPGAGPFTVDAYRVFALGENPATGNPILTLHAALRQARRIKATTLAP